MSTWIKDNKSIASVIGVGAIAFLGLASFGVIKSLEESDLQEQFQTTKGQIEDAAGRNQTPTSKVAEERAAAVKAYENQLNKVVESYTAFQPTAEDLKIVTPEEFRLKLESTTAQLKKAATERNVKFKNDFKLGFEAYSVAPALQQATGVLQYELGAVNWLLQKAIQNDVTEIIRVYREKTPQETAEAPKTTTKGTPARPATSSVAAAPQPGTDGLYQKLPISITLKGGRRSINKFINDIISSDKYLFTIQALRGINEKSNALTIATAPVSSAASSSSKGGSLDFAAAFGGSKSKDAEKAAKKEIVEEILSPVVGGEQIEFHIVLNLILLNPEKATVKTTAAK